MQYLGGKSQSGKAIVQAITPWIQGALFVDAFCGALNVVRHVRGERMALDACQPLITLLQAVQGGWQPPERVTEWQYHRIKERPDPWNPLTAFVLFGCSYGGRWGEGFARATRGTDYVRCARNSLLRKLQDCRDLEILCRDYRQIPAPNPRVVLYCDIPYRGTKTYGAVPAFDHGAFWDHAAWWTRCGARVFVSEGVDAAPPWDWVIYREWSQTSRLDPDRTGRSRIERLYVHRKSPMGWKC